MNSSETRQPSLADLKSEWSTALQEGVGIDCEGTVIEIAADGRGIFDIIEQALDDTKDRHHLFGQVTGHLAKLIYEQWSGDCDVLLLTDQSFLENVGIRITINLVDEEIAIWNRLQEDPEIFIYDMNELSEPIR